MSENYQGCCPSDPQRHLHEVLGSVEIAEEMCDPHNHRFATVSGEAIATDNNSHVHKVKFRTDFYEDHFHEFEGLSSEAIPVGDGRHVHFLQAQTRISEGHRHDFRVAFLINDPIGE